MKKIMRALVAGTAFTLAASVHATRRQRSRRSASALHDE